MMVFGAVKIRRARAVGLLELNGGHGWKLESAAMFALPPLWGVNGLPGCQIEAVWSCDRNDVPAV